MSDKPLRRIRLDRHETRARANGYVGTWPPRWPAVNTPAQFEDVLTKLESGEHRAAYIHTLGCRLVAFYGQLMPDHYRRLARVVKVVVLDKKTAPRVRLRGIQVVLRPLVDAAALAARAGRGPQPAMLDHLQECVRAFYEQLTDRDLQAFAGVLTDLAAEPKPGVSLRAVETALRLVLDGQKLVANVEAVERGAAVPSDDDPHVQEAARQLAQWETEIIEEHRTGKRSDP